MQARETREHPCWLGVRTHPAPIGTGQGGPREGSGSTGPLSCIISIYYAGSAGQFPCLRWHLPPSSPTLAQWSNGSTVLTVHHASKQPRPYPKTSRTEKTRPHLRPVELVPQWPGVVLGPVVLRVGGGAQLLLRRIGKRREQVGFSQTHTKASPAGWWSQRKPWLTAWAIAASIYFFRLGLGQCSLGHRLRFTGSGSKWRRAVSNLVASQVPWHFQECARLPAQRRLLRVLDPLRREDLPTPLQQVGAHAPRALLRCC